MNSILAFGHNVVDLGESILGGVADLESASRHEARVVDGEHHCIEQRLVLLVKRTVDEDVVFEGGHL
jgi:hypothetical protein